MRAAPRFLIALFLLAALSVQAARRVSMEADIRIDDAVSGAVDVVDRFGDALAAGDIAALKPLLAEDAVVYESGVGVFTRDEYLADHAEADANLLQVSEETMSSRIARGNKQMAWVVTQAVMQIPDAPAETHSTETMVLEKRRGDWKIVHIHWSSR